MVTDEIYAAHLVYVLGAKLGRLIVIEEQHNNNHLTAPRIDVIQGQLQNLLRAQLYQVGDAVLSLVPDEFVVTVLASPKFKIGFNPNDGECVPVWFGTSGTTKELLMNFVVKAERVVEKT